MVDEAAGSADHGVQVGAARILNAMSVDVEDYFHVSALASSVRRGEWPQMEYRAESSTHKLLAIFDEFEVKATFYVLGWLAEKSPGLVREIHAEGHEVACHGLAHELVYQQTPGDFLGQTRTAKQVLEDIIGDRVLGYRAASWSITDQSLWALDIILDLGFRYDSSVFPIRHDRYGIPSASPRPGLISTPSGRKVVEFPPSTIDLFGQRLPVSGGGYFRILPYGWTRFGLRRVNEKSNQPINFYLHPWEVDPKQPRIKTSWFSRFRHYTNLDRTEHRLRRLLKEFSFTTTRNVLTELKLLG